MRGTTKLAMVAAIAAGGLSLGASAAKAEIVCNRVGDCWHVHRHYEYRPEWGIVVHPDNWRWRDDDNDRDHHWRWREHRGRGYWGPNGVWIRF